MPLPDITVTASPLSEPGAEEARLAASFLEDRASLPGRAVVFGGRSYF